MTKKLAPMHPGEVLREEFLVPFKLSAGALARKMDVPRTRIERIAEEATGITADTALRLSKALGTTPQLWLNLENDYDLLQMATRALGKSWRRSSRWPNPAARRPPDKNTPPEKWLGVSFPRLAPKRCRRVPVRPRWDLSATPMTQIERFLVEPASC
jgi:antitoxin HigA-1